MANIWWEEYSLWIQDTAGFIVDTAAMDSLNTEALITYSVTSMLNDI